MFLYNGCLVNFKHDMNIKLWNGKLHKGRNDSNQDSKKASSK